MKVDSHSWETGKAEENLVLKSRLLNGILLWCCLHYILAVGVECQAKEILCCSETTQKLYYCILLQPKPFFLWILFTEQHGPASPVELAPRQGHVPGFWSYVVFCFQLRKVSWLNPLCRELISSFAERKEVWAEVFLYEEKLQKYYIIDLKVIEAAAG